jgi:hypothetical protein
MILHLPKANKEDAMDTNSPQVSLPLPEARKRSGLGIGSFISAIVAFLFMCPLFFILIQFMRITLPSTLQEMENFALEHFLELMFLGGLTALLGVGLGIPVVFQKGTRITFGIVFGVLGFVVSALVLLGVCILFVIYALFVGSFYG